MSNEASSSASAAAAGVAVRDAGDDQPSASGAAAGVAVRKVGDDKPSASGSAAGMALRDVGDYNPSSSAEVDIAYWAAQEEAAARLESMAARARGEDDLSEEELEANNQLQEDEVIALKAIFGDDMVILEDKDTLRFIQHLPPVVLTCLLPRSYPSICAPYFTISAKWLDEPKVSYLCAALDEIWTELPGQEVIFRWVDWLNSSLWSCIALNDEISYSEKRSHKIFSESFFVCGICLSEDSTAQGVMLLAWKLTTMLNVPVVFLLSALCANNAAMWEIHERQKLHSIPEEQLLREQRETDELINVQEALRDAKQCPRCKMAISKIEGCNKMTCSNCGRFFCYRCNEAIGGYDHFWNGNCTMFEVQQFQNPQQQGDENDVFDQDDEELLEPIWVPFTYPCPTCGRRNEKWGTNNHILCTGCRGHYCALCRKRIPRGTQHFGARAQPISDKFLPIARL
uniref:RBR-type E3 ubiquitin transferase n=1 Tax=Leersia perrieri TaxID=77586 RepID=A0A0D9VJR9_9ORYZ